MPEAPFPIDPHLTGIAIAYRNNALIADQVLPRIPVDQSKYTYWEYPVGEAFTVPDTKVGRRGQPNEVEFNATEKTSSTLDYGLDDAVPQSDIDAARSNRNGYDPVAHATEYVSDLIALDREIRTAGLVFNAGTYGAGNKIVLAGTSQFSDFANSKPIEVINDGLDATKILRPNVMVIGELAWSKLRQTPDIVKAVHGTSGDKGMASRQAVAELFELDEVVVGRGWLNSAKKGQAPNMSRVWGKHIALIHRNRLANNQRGVTFGWTAEWGTRNAGSMPDAKISVRGGQRVRVWESVEEKIVAPDVGYFIEDAVA